MDMFDRRQRFVTWIAAGCVIIACTFSAAVVANAQELVTNGGFSAGLDGWGQTNFGSPGGTFGINANGPTDTSAASGNYAYAGGAQYNLLTQDVNVTTGSAYRLSFLAGSKSGQGAAYGILSLRQDALSNYNAASFDYGPSDAVFGSYTVDFVADTTSVGLWLRNDAGTYEAYDNVSVTPIASVVNAMNYSSASGYSVISSALTGSGKVTVGAGTGGLTLSGANTHTGGTEVTGGTLFVSGAGTLGAASGNVTVSGGGILDLRNQQTRTGTIAMTWQDARITSGDLNNPGSLVNNGVFQFGGGLVSVPVSGSGSFNVTGGGSITGSNSYTGPTTISVTTGWYGTNQLFVDNANALGAASGDLTISGGNVNLQNNTITRSGNVTVSGGSLQTGTISKSGSDYNIQGGSVGAVLAGTAGLTKSGAGTATLSGTNSYSGGTTVTGGDLYASQANALGDAAGAVTVNGGTLWVNANMTRAGTVTVNGADLGGNGSTLTNNGGGFVLTGSYAAAGNLVLDGSGGLTASSADARLWSQATYSGATAVTSGTLNICGVGGIPTASPVSIASGAAVNLTSYYAATNVNRTIGGLTGNGVLYGGGGTVTVNKTAGTDTFSGDIQGAQGFIKAGSGTLILAGASTYAGATLVSGGKLLVNGNNSSATGAVTVDGEATLGGSGSIGGATTVNGTLSPGNSPGVLSIASLVLGGSSTSLFEIGGTSRGTAYDGVDITSGGLTYGGAVSLAFTSTFGDNTTFNLFDFAGALSGDFSSVTATGLYGSLTFTNDGFGVWTSGSTSVAGQTITFTQSTGDLAIVPEPGALTLAGLGIAAAAWAFRRRT